MKCNRLTPEQVKEQERPYMLAHDFNAGLEDVGNLLMCNIHRRPLIECHDEEHNR
jgi:hypothetical protein